MRSGWRSAEMSGIAALLWVAIGPVTVRAQNEIVETPTPEVDPAGFPVPSLEGFRPLEVTVEEVTQWRKRHER